MLTSNAGALIAANKCMEDWFGEGWRNKIHLLSTIIDLSSSFPNNGVLMGVVLRDGNSTLIFISELPLNQDYKSMNNTMKDED